MKFLHKKVRKLSKVEVYAVKGNEKVLLFCLNLLPKNIKVDMRPEIEGFWDITSEVTTEEKEVPIWKD